MDVAKTADSLTEHWRHRLAGKQVPAVLVDETDVDVHPRTGPVVMRLGHEGRIEIMRAGGSLDRALQQYAVERGRQGIAVLQVDFKLAGTRFLHHGIDRQALSFGDTVNVVDERPERIHFLELECHRPFGIGRETRAASRE